VVIQNRGSFNEIFPDAAALARLVHVVVASLGSCPAPMPVLSEGRLAFPVLLGPGKKLTVAYDVAIDCANDPNRSTRAEPGQDYAVSAAVDRLALDGQVDADLADDVCTRMPAIPPTARDAGCGLRNPDGSLGAPLIDVVVR
jgi:hypothetical protein